MKRQKAAHFNIRAKCAVCYCTVLGSVGLTCNAFCTMQYRTTRKLLMNINIAIIALLQFIIESWVLY